MSLLDCEQFWISLGAITIFLKRWFNGFLLTDWQTDWLTEFFIRHCFSLASCINQLSRCSLDVGNKVRHTAVQSDVVTSNRTQLPSGRPGYFPGTLRKFKITPIVRRYFYELSVLLTPNTGMINPEIISKNTLESDACSSFRLNYL
jgi:hypothetical protein